jgi:Flp pilus assembly protein TadG
MSPIDRMTARHRPVLAGWGDVARTMASDLRGVSAIEFALVLPFLLATYFGVIELVQTATVNGLVAQASSTVTNIVTQYTTISASTQMPDILNAASQILAPYPSATGGIVVTCITIDGSGNATVAWSQSLNVTAQTPGQSVTLPASLDIPNTTLILGQTSYALPPIVDFLSLGPFQLSSSVYMSPRNSTTINLAP